MNNMQPSISMQIPTTIWSTSLVRVKGDFPRGYGNYISLYDESKKEEYLVVNLSYEDLKDAIRLGIVGDTIEADVYDFDGQKVAFITDIRLPEKARSPRWWYSYRGLAKEAIFRKELNIYTDECLCKNPQVKYSYMCNTRISYPTEKKPFTTLFYQCSCGNEETQQIPKKNEDVS